MNSPVAALTWEIWRKNRVGFWLLFLFLILCAGLSRLSVHFTIEASRLSGLLARDEPVLIEAMARASDWREFVLGWAVFFLAGSLLVAFGVFAFSESHVTRGFSGIPSRLFTLPVPTVQLVGLPVLLGLWVVSTIYMLWSRLVLTPVLPGETVMPDAYLLLLLASGLVAFQMLVWTLPGFPKIRATMLILLVTCMVFLSSLPFQDIARWPERRLALMIVFSVVLVAAPVIAAVGVANARKGDWREWPVLTAWMTRLANQFSRRREFRSTGAALFWIEFRRAGRPMLGGLAAFVLCVLGAGAYGVASSQNGNDISADLFGGITSPILMILVSIWTPVLGLVACSDAVSRGRWMTTLQATRPVTAGEMVAAKLRAMLTVCLLGWLFAGVMISIWAVACNRTDVMLHRFENDWDETVLIAAIVISLHTLIGLFPLWLTGRVPGLPWSFLGLYCAYAVAINVVTWFARHPQFQDVALVLIGFAMAAKLGVAAAAFREGLKRCLVTRRFVFAVTAIWIIGTAGLISLLVSFPYQSGWSDALILSCPVLLFPFARIALAPLALAANRHR